MVFLNTVQLHQPQDSRRVTLGPAVFQNVPHPNTFLVQIPGDQNCPVTSQRLLLGAHDRNLKSLHAGKQALNPSPEDRSLCNQRVLGTPIAIASWVARTGAQFMPQKNVLDPRIPQHAGQFLAIELRIETAVRLRAHVSNRCNAMLPQESDQSPNRSIRMSDCINSSIHQKVWINPSF